MVKTTELRKMALVVDGNWLLMSRYFMKRDDFRADLPENVKEESAIELASLMSQSISVVLRLFAPHITNLILVTDNRSWRKEYPQPLFLKKKADLYKGTRSRDSEYDWKYIYKSLDVLVKRLGSLGVTVANRYGVEGDDWAWWWSRKLNSEGTDVILWSSDEDIKQLIQEDTDTGSFTGWYEKSKGLVLHSCMAPEPAASEEVDELSFFLKPIRTLHPMITAISKFVKVTYVNPIEIINKKIYIGDAGDNITPVYTFTSGPKTYKATLKDWQKVTSFSEPLYEASGWEESLRPVYKKISSIKGNKKTAPTIDEFAEHAIYNRKMVWLHESQIPAHIQSQMTGVEYKEISKDLMHDLVYNWKTMIERRDDNISELFDSMFDENGEYII